MPQFCAGHMKMKQMKSFAITVHLAQKWDITYAEWFSREYVAGHIFFRAYDRFSTNHVQKELGYISDHFMATLAEHIIFHL